MQTESNITKQLTSCYASLEKLEGKKQPSMSIDSWNMHFDESSKIKTYSASNLTPCQMNWSYDSFDSGGCHI